MSTDRLIITPKTKVLELLKNYPQLEETLQGVAPAFKKLKNPVLRKTVGKVATLQQAAAIGNVKIEDLINTLRKEVGQDFFAGNEEMKIDTNKPDWFDETKVVSELDARSMLENGEHPVNQVISDLRKLSSGDIYKLTAPFLPAPLIDKASSLKFVHWVDKKTENQVDVYFYLSEL